MRKRKTIKIDDREITVQELTVQDMLDLAAAGQVLDFTDLDGFRSVADTWLPRAADIRADDLLKMAPSELQVIWDAFREVNAVFFGLAGAAGLGDAVKKLMGSRTAISSGPSVGSSPGDTPAP